MGIGDLQLRAMDDVVRHVQDVHATFVAAREIHDPLFFAGTRGGFSRARAVASANGPAEQAERLLAPIAAREPGLEPLLDAVRGARSVQGVAFPGRNMVVSVSYDLERELWAAKAWQQVQPLGRDARQSELTRIRTTGSRHLTQDDWRTLAGILGDDIDGAITSDVPRSIGDALSLRDLALRSAETGTYANHGSPFYVGHQYFEAWNAAQQPVDVRRARLAELFTGDPAARTKEEWREATALLRAGGHDMVEHPWFPGQQLDRATRNAQLGSYETARDARPIIERANAAELERVRRHLLQAGELDELAQSALRQGKLELVGITGAEASAVRLRHLLPSDPANAKAWMLDVRAALETASPGGPTAQLRDTAFGLLDRNLARTNGERWWRPRDGYANHPDYAELGRVRSIYQLLEQVGAIKVHPWSQPATRPSPVTAPPSVASDGAERLTW